MTNNKFSDKELKEKLTPEEYKILREGGTEAPFTGKYNDHFESGMYTCKVCGAELFSSDTKYDTNTGWPSFNDIVDENSVYLKDDYSFGMHRKEVFCSQCDSHLGHMFEDSGSNTSKDYCINSACLNFKKQNI